MGPAAFRRIPVNFGAASPAPKEGAVVVLHPGEYIIIYMYNLLKKESIYTILIMYDGVRPAELAHLCALPFSARPGVLGERLLQEDVMGH